MSNRFTPPSAEELAARGLNPDGTPMKNSEPVKEPASEKPAPQKPAAKKG